MHILSQFKHKHNKFYPLTGFQKYHQAKRQGKDISLIARDQRHKILSGNQILAIFLPSGIRYRYLFLWHQPKHLSNASFRKECGTFPPKLPSL